MNKKVVMKAEIQKKILVIGDPILDIYHHGTVLGISAETPTLVGREEKTVISHGGAALLVRNMLELGISVSFLTLSGDDALSEHQSRWTHKNLEKIMIREKGRKTTAKERFWVSSHKLLQWGYLDDRPASQASYQKIKSFLKKNIGKFDTVIVSDYRHGTVSEKLAHDIVKICSENKKPLYIDSQVSQKSGNHIWYKGATLFSLNEREAKSIDPEFDPRKIPSSLSRLKKILKTKYVILKIGEKGSVALIADRVVSAKPYAVKAVDTTGAGDAYLAALALAGKEVTKKDLERANTWAALSTTVIGAEPPSFSVFQKITSSQ